MCISLDPIQIHRRKFSFLKGITRTWVVCPSFLPTWKSSLSLFSTNYNHASHYYHLYLAKFYNLKVVSLLSLAIACVFESMSSNHARRHTPGWEVCSIIITSLINMLYDLDMPSYITHIFPQSLVHPSLAWVVITSQVRLPLFACSQYIFRVFALFWPVQVVLWSYWRALHASVIVFHVTCARFINNI